MRRLAIAPPKSGVSRRSLVAGVGIGAVALSSTNAIAEPPAADNELVAMGHVLDTLLPDLDRRHTQQQCRIEVAHTAARADPAWLTTSPQQRFDMLGQYEDLHGVNDADVDMEAPSMVLDRLARRSETITATTWAGLRTKARLVAWAHGALGEDDSELRSLLANLGALPSATSDPCALG